ncbi:MAG TPA: hypothetical protein VGP48_08530 [Stellaceae bacterium]|nr:hypothetical protein [Stellaceae bacterium]
MSDSNRPRIARPRRRDLLVAGATSLLLPKRERADRALERVAAEEIPAAVSGTGWSRKSNWNFGTLPGNNITRFGDWLAAGWFMDETPKWLNNECQTYNTTDLSNGNPNFMPFADYGDIVAIWNGRAIEAARGNGSISSLMLRYDVPFANAVGYYELTGRIPSVSGAWPAWWTLGHAPRSGRGTYSWGPEIDILESYDTKTNNITSTLHGSKTPSNCFLSGGGNPPGKVGASATYGADPWNMGHFDYRPGTDFARAFHRFGAKIAPDYNISIWIDDVAVGTFAANQYCDDGGRPVAVELLVNLALGTDNPDPVGSIHPADFGGVDNRGPTNKFRLSLKNIQIWGP